VSVVEPEPGRPRHADGGPLDWVPGRGDYGTEYAFALVEIIEEHNCSKGCVFAVRDAVDEWGPGGNCSVLAMIGADVPVPELNPLPAGPVCRKREAPPSEFDLSTVGMDPLL